ncbi:hypothetical protein C1I93_02165 [Micromonospora endophytica]|uniref:PAP2 superfamily protein n=1 Tax=Micromonospora endophytica TaxID=515350 RepID=A0A2W2CM38_9ACTN|nr:hypothetical protein C1I93_02165 [Micromonospora endophytica]RIW45879.1 hypothetical protein D3H59_13940 [Micromonospora endophytica]
MLLAGVGGASTVGLAALGTTGAAAAGPATTAQTPPPAPDFNLDTDNFIRDLIAKNDRSLVQEVIAPMDVTHLARVTHLTTTAWFDAVAPYHPTAVGVHSRLGRRPSSESTTNRNKNIAALHASYQVMKGVLPHREPLFRAMLTSLGLNPDDNSSDQTSPVGIGNLAGKAIVAVALKDGMNQLGNEGGRKYNPVPYADYTGYQPVNTAYRLTNPSRWQPQLGPHSRRLGPATGDLGVFTVQQFITPQMRLVKPHTYRDPRQFTIAAPQHSDHTRVQDYKRSVNEILEASAALTAEQKVMAEFFDNKLLGIGLSVNAAALAHGQLDLDGWVHLFMTNSVAIYDALIAAWHQKTVYDTVRPFSAVNHVYGRTKVRAWGGPGVGTVNDIPANEWVSYLKVGDHPEYPSGSTTLCSAEAQATRRFLGSDVLNWRHHVAAGSTLVEPGITPATDIELHFPTWTDFVQKCATSRVWGGVHFAKTVERSIPFGAQFGDLAYEWVQGYIQGTAQS